MPRTSYDIESDSMKPPVPDVELGLFTFALQSETLRECLRLIEIKIPKVFRIFHNTGGDDPPDIEAFSLGWELTSFPPNQMPLAAVSRARAKQTVAPPTLINIPGFSQTGADIKAIKRLSVPISLVRPQSVSVEKEIAAMEKHFEDEVLKKDVFGNHLLLLDQRREPSDSPREAVSRCLKRVPLQFVWAVILVGVARTQSGDIRPDVVCFYRAMNASMRTKNPPLARR